jgi:chromosome segregation ATPase
MASSNVANPIPKGTKTINDMISSYDTGDYQSKQSMDKRRISLRNKNNDISNASDYSSYDRHNGYNTSTSKVQKIKKKRGLTLSKNRSGTTHNRNLARNTGTISLKTNAPQNDFDVLTVNDGMQEIDIILDTLENDIPDDVYENEDFDVDQMMKVNRGLRDKILEISSFVITAITKASQLKKRIVSHRDQPVSSDLRGKMKVIKDYQNKLNVYKKKVNGMNIKIASLSDNENIANSQNNIKTLNQEIKELKQQRGVLSKQLKHQQTTMNKLYDDPDFRDKMEQSRDDIKNIKSNYYELDSEHKVLSAKQDKILKQMANLNTANTKLRERKINIENGVKEKGYPSNITKYSEEASVIQSKNMVIKKIQDKNKTKNKIKLNEKESRMIDVENEILELQEAIIQRDRDNEKLSKEVKNLKRMIPKPDIKISTKQSETFDKAEMNNISQNIGNDEPLKLGSDKDGETQEQDSGDDIEDAELSPDRKSDKDSGN